MRSSSEEANLWDARYRLRNNFVKRYLTRYLTGLSLGSRVAARRRLLCYVLR